MVRGGAVGFGTSGWGAGVVGKRYVGSGVVWGGAVGFGTSGWGASVVKIYVGSDEDPGNVGTGVGRPTGGVGARVLFVPAWTAGMIRRKTLDFIVKDFLNSEFKVAVLNLKLTKNELTVCKRREVIVLLNAIIIHWLTQVRGEVGGIFSSMANRSQIKPASTCCF
jgi:hypothetical protein